MTEAAQRHHSKSPVSRMVLRLGVARAVAVATLLSVVFSVLLAVALDGLLKRQLLTVDLWIAAVIPALVAPPVTAVFIRLVHQLEMTEQRLWQLVTEDELSGVASRRHFMAQLRREWERAKRSSLPLSLLMLDLDHFKRVNDSGGHASGDRVIHTLGQILLETCRRVDVAGRYGGEEFMLLLPDTSLEEALLVAERLRSVVERELAVRAALPFAVTVSIGVACLPAAGDLSGEVALMERADAALYAAKAAGRNCVMSDAGSDRA